MNEVKHLCTYAKWNRETEFFTVNVLFNSCISTWPGLFLTDIAMLVLEKCTTEDNDRDDTTFAMSFNYEFVEDFHMDMKREPAGASNEIFSNAETDSADAFGGEEGEVDGVELKEVVTHTDGGKRIVLRDTTSSKE